MLTQEQRDLVRGDTVIVARPGCPTFQGRVTDSGDDHWLTVEVIGAHPPPEGTPKIGAIYKPWRKWLTLAVKAPVLPGVLATPTAGSILRKGAPVVDDAHGPGVVHVVYADAVTALVSRDGGIGERLVDRLSLDLSDELGQRVAESWLARHLGIANGLAPRFGHTSKLRPKDGRPPCWYIGTGVGVVYFLAAEPDHWPSKLPYRVIPALASASDDMAALVAVCLDAGGAS